MSKAAHKVYSLLDEQLTNSSKRPGRLYVYPKQHAAVVRSRQRRKSGPAVPPEDLEFKQYRGIPIEIVGEDYAK